MKHTILFLSIILLSTSILVAQKTSSKKKDNNSKTTNGAKDIEAPQAVEGDVVFSDGTNQLLRITDEGTTGAIQFQDGVPTETDFKLYRNGTDLFFGSSNLSGSGAALSLDDLEDAKYENASLFLGNEAGLNNGNAYGNVGIGWQALYSSSAFSNLAIGRAAGFHNTTGMQNVLIGAEANRYNQSGSNNTIIGFQAGFGVDNILHNKSGSVFIGFSAGRNELTSNKLYIENSESDIPLIWGDFEEDSLKFNGDVHITKTLSAGSGTKVLAPNSVAFGDNTETHGLSSIAAGKENLAWGFHSSAFGLGTKAMSYISTAIGRYNVGDVLDSQTDWNEADVLFEIGNGTDNDNRSNAVTVLKNGNVGFGPSAPTASFHVDAVNGIVFDGSTTGSIPVEGSGSRMMWYQAKSAFRAGSVQTQWDDANIGSYSAALNYRTTASGTYSFATGYQTEASGQRATAMGSSTIASGLHSTAIGSNAEAVGNYSTAIGRYVRATGNGTVVLGDNSSGATLLDATADNKFTARFAGGFRLITNSNSPYVGVKLDAGANSWSIVSDSTKKENFKLVDIEEILNKISKFNLTSWNYKAQDQSKFRHYGPMAQDFYAAFGNDGIGTVGNDTTIASADFNGINFIAIQALEKRSRDLDKRIKNQDKRIDELEKHNKELVLINSDYRNQNTHLMKEIEKIKQAITYIKTNNSIIKLTLDH